MENENVKNLIEMIDKIDIKDKLRLAICMSQDKWSGLKFNTKDNYEKFDNMLKSIDEEYRTTNINMAKYFNVMFAEAKLMESPVEQQNQVALYLFNSIKLGKYVKNYNVRLFFGVKHFYAKQKRCLLPLHLFLTI